MLDVDDGTPISGLVTLPRSSNLHRDVLRRSRTTISCTPPTLSRDEEEKYQVTPSPQDVLDFAARPPSEHDGPCSEASPPVVAL